MKILRNSLLGKCGCGNNYTKVIIGKGKTRNEQVFCDKCMPEMLEELLE